MATAERHAGGRPRTREPSALFVRIEAMAKRRGLRLDEAASAAGVNLTTLYYMDNPKLSTLRQIASAIGVRVGTLVD